VANHAVPLLQVVTVQLFTSALHCARSGLRLRQAFPSNLRPRVVPVFASTPLPASQARTSSTSYGVHLPPRPHHCLWLAPWGEKKKGGKKKLGGGPLFHEYGVRLPPGYCTGSLHDRPSSEHVIQLTEYRALRLFCHAYPCMRRIRFACAYVIGLLGFLQTPTVGQVTPFAIQIVFPSVGVDSTFFQWTGFAGFSPETKSRPCHQGRAFQQSACGLQT